MNNISDNVQSIFALKELLNQEDDDEEEIVMNPTKGIIYNNINKFIIIGSELNPG